MAMQTISFEVSVGQAVKEINEIWQQISRIHGLSEGNKIWQLVREALHTSPPRLVNVGPGGSPLGPKIVKDVKNVTLFSYTVWPTAMKFGMVWGIGA